MIMASLSIVSNPTSHTELKFRKAYILMIPNGIYEDTNKP